jgi:tetratricopeptide (TPR) repeat protein
MTQLDRRGSEGPAVQVVTGTQGAGKTELAAAYARAKLAGGWRLVAWINAQDTASLMAGLHAVADAPRLSDRSPGRSAVDVGNVLRHRLETDGDRCLLVFDSARDPDLLRPYVPAAGAARVLITGSCESLAELGTEIPVDVFTAEEAMAFLTGHTGLEDAPGAATVAAELGHLPLAMAQAAAVIAARQLDYRTYLDRLRAVQVEEYLLPEQRHAYQSRVAEAVLLSLEAVRESDEVGVCGRVMELLAVLSGAGVRRELLHTAGQAGVLTPDGRQVPMDLIDQALDRLIGWPLLTLSLDGQVVRAQRLVSQIVRDGSVCRNRLPAACRAAASVLEAYARTLVGSQDRALVRDFAEQVAALAGSTAELVGEDGRELERTLLGLRFLVLYHLIELGDSASQAVTVGEPLVADLDRLLGPGHPDTLNAQNSLAAAYRTSGRSAEAISMFEQILVGRERALGPEHPDTLTSQNNLATAYQEADRAAEAILLFKLTLAARDRLLGADHPSTLRSQANLAAAYRAAGRTAEAIGLFEETLIARELVLGRGHPDTLRSRTTLANVYRTTGRIAEAIPLVEQILVAHERLLGAGHPTTLASRNNLAAAYRDAGRVAEAIPLLEQTLAARERLLGADHPSTLASRHNLANAYRDAGRPSEAIPMHEEALAACERLMGADHAKTVGSRSNLAAAYRDAGRVTDAIPLFEQTLTTRERLLGADHPSTVVSRGNLAAAYHEAGRGAEAMPLFEQTVADWERLLGSDHTETLKARDHLAAAYKGAGRLVEAVLLIEQTLEARERLLGADHPSTLRTRENLDHAYQEASRAE